MSRLKFNGKELPSFVRYVGRDFSVLPDINVNYTELPRQLGGSFLYAKQGVRKESLDFILIPSKTSNLEKDAAAFAEWLRGDNFKPSKLEFPETADRYSLSQVNGSVSVNDLFVYGTCSVEFISVDPLNYMNNPLSVTGASALNVTYQGSVPQPFITEITVPSVCSRLKLESNKDNSFIQLDGSFTTGQKIVIDSDKKVITVSGQVNMKVLSLDSNWMVLQTGTNKLTLSVNNYISTAALKITSKIANY